MAKDERVARLRYGKISLQGLKVKGTLDLWVKEHGDKECYIYSNEHWRYWRPNGCGYTDQRAPAGVYTFREAVEWTRHCGPEKQIVYIFK